MGVLGEILQGEDKKPAFDTSISAWLDRLMRPQYASVGVARSLIEGRPEDIPEAIVSGLKGETKGSYRDIAEENDLPAPFWWGLAGDIALDPLTYVPVGKIAKGIASPISKIPAVARAGESLRATEAVQTLGKSLIPNFRPTGVSKEMWGKLTEIKQLAKGVERLGTEDTIKFSTTIATDIKKLMKSGKVGEEDLGKIISSVERGSFKFGLPEETRPIYDKLTDFWAKIGERRKGIGKSILSDDEYNYFLRQLSKEELEKLQKTGMDVGFRDFSTKTSSDIARKYMKFTNFKENKDLFGKADKLGLTKIGVNTIKNKEDELIDSLLKFDKEKVAREIKIGSVTFSKENAIKQSKELQELLNFRNSEGKALFGSAGNIFDKVITAEHARLKAKLNLSELLAGKKGLELDRLINSQVYLDIVSRYQKASESVKLFESQLNNIPNKFWSKFNGFFRDDSGKIHIAREADALELKNAGIKIFSEDIPFLTYVGGKRMAKAESGKFFFDEVKKLGSPKKVEGWVKSTKPELSGSYFNPQIAKEIDLTSKAFVGEEVTKDFLKLYDSTQNFWKAWTLGVFPSYHFRNFLGNMWNNYIGGVVNPMVYKQAADIQIKIAKGIALNSKEELIYKLSQKFGITGKGLMRAEVPTLETPSLKEGIKSSLTAAPRKGLELGGHVEDNARLAHFIDKLNKKWSPQEAAQSVKKYLFDYDEITPFEKNVLRRMMPFYTWTRKNLPLQLETIIQKTGKVLPVEKIRQGMAAESGNPPEDLMPDWVKEKMPVITGNDGKEISYFPLESWLPYADISKIGRPSEVVGELLSPLIKTPIELITNRSMYFEEPIERYKGETKEFLGMDMPVRVEYVMKQIRLLNEIHRMIGYKDRGGEAPPQPTSPERILRFLTGVKTYRYDLEKEARSKIWELSKDLQALTIGLKRAEKYGRIPEQERIAEQVATIGSKIKDLRSKYKVRK